MLIADGRRVAFLSRGYGGAKRVEPVRVDPDVHNAEMVGDEPLLLARVASCWVGADRVRGAMMAVEAGADVLLLDDGLQNPALTKDLAFAVVDGEQRFGNGLCVPAGPLRAPVAAQARFVQALIVIGGDEQGALEISAAAPAKPILRANLEPDAYAAAPLIGREVGRVRRHRTAGKVLRDAEARRRPDRRDARLSRPSSVFARAKSKRWWTKPPGGARCSRPRKRTASGSRRRSPARCCTLPATLRFDEPAAARDVLRRFCPERQAAQQVGRRRGTEPVSLSRGGMLRPTLCSAGGPG